MAPHDSYQDELRAIHGTIEACFPPAQHTGNAVLQAYVDTLADGTENYALILADIVRQDTPQLVAYRLRHNLEELIAHENQLALSIAKPLLHALGIIPKTDNADVIL